MILLLVLLLKPANKVTQFANKNLPRGIRNNNPGNLVKSSAKWRGKVKNPLEARFESFDTMDNGLRAAIRNAYTQWNRGKTTIQKLITVWAPDFENDTKAYVAQVAKAAGINKDTPFTWGGNATTAKIMLAIFKHENDASNSKYKYDFSSYITYEKVLGICKAEWPKG